ncbi:carbon-nitrogen hydrolase family protein [Umezawaea sp. Da 62-37]|uniref:carbon-nitrogen hydrolase family protein n=1 Tax=Umezawaea sp. Da 62-37 TaxID=3075927 RepID=UPI0028F6C29B|nr:carbon-nitrogen hydrolase family protein [Umezawaea sp. Da 62-37]WNV86071.1 carbon-nitrogen hydrolase family protein [Umezawaea sp. Da 62-37]
MSETRTLRLAVAQTHLRPDPGDRDELRESGRDVRALVREAHEAGARVVHFPEGAMCSPHKRVMSADGPDRVGPARWDRFDWEVHRRELTATAALAGELGIWVVLGAVHRLTGPRRPHNSLYVISDRGRVATRYDERMLSNTKVTRMYTPGAAPVTFEVDGVRFGLALGMEVHFPEVFLEYERLDVDCVLFSTAGPGGPDVDDVFALEARAHAATNSFWVSCSGPATVDAPSGITSPDGRWAARCPRDGVRAIVVADLGRDPDDPARPWRRTARSGVYDPHLAHDDVRSGDRSAF